MTKRSLRFTVNGRPCEDAVGDDMLARLGKLVQKQVGPMRTTVTQSNYRRLARERAAAVPN